MSNRTEFSSTKHDWHSEKYVDQWIVRDILRARERRPLLRQMVSFISAEPAAPLRVLDVGGGYGAVTSEVLQAFPNARVVLQDYSSQMLDRARQQLSTSFGSQVEYAQSDLRDALWMLPLIEKDGPFDVVVSAIAIHNLRTDDLVVDCYRAIRYALVAGGQFLDCDHFDHIGGVAGNVKKLLDAGFEDVESRLEVAGTAVLCAYRPAD